MLVQLAGEEALQQFLLVQGQPLHAFGDVGAQLPGDGVQVLELTAEADLRDRHTVLTAEHRPDVDGVTQQLLLATAETVLGSLELVAQPIGVVRQLRPCRHDLPGMLQCRADPPVVRCAVHRDVEHAQDPQLDQRDELGGDLVAVCFGLLVRFRRVLEGRTGGTDALEDRFPTDLEPVAFLLVLGALGGGVTDLCADVVGLCADHVRQRRHALGQPIAFRDGAPSGPLVVSNALGDRGTTRRRPVTDLSLVDPALQRRQPRQRLLAPLPGRRCELVEPVNVGGEAHLQRGGVATVGGLGVCGPCPGQDLLGPCQAAACLRQLACCCLCPRPGVQHGAGRGKGVQLFVELFTTPGGCVERDAGVAEPSVELGEPVIELVQPLLAGAFACRGAEVADLLARCAPVQRPHREAAARADTGVAAVGEPQPVPDLELLLGEHRNATEDRRDRVLAHLLVLHRSRDVRQGAPVRGVALEQHHLPLVGVEEGAVWQHPRIQQPQRVQRCLDVGLLGWRQLVGELGKEVERRPGSLAAIRGTPCRCRWGLVGGSREPVALLARRGTVVLERRHPAASVQHRTVELLAAVRGRRPRRTGCLLGVGVDQHRDSRLVEGKDVGGFCPLPHGVREVLAGSALGGVGLLGGIGGVADRGVGVLPCALRPFDLALRRVHLGDGRPHGGDGSATLVGHGPRRPADRRQALRDVCHLDLGERIEIGQRTTDARVLVDEVGVAGGGPCPPLHCGDGARALGQLPLRGLQLGGHRRELLAAGVAAAVGVGGKVDRLGVLLLGLFEVLHGPVGVGLLERGQPLLGRSQRPGDLADRRHQLVALGEGCVARLASIADGLGGAAQLRVGAGDLPCPGGGHDVGVVGVEVEEVAHGGQRAAAVGEFGAVRLEPVEALCDLAQPVLVQWREAVGEDRVELGRFEAL